MDNQTSSPHIKAKRLASEATARLVLGLPFTAIDFKKGILIGVEARYPAPIWSSKNVGKAIDLGTVSLVDGEIVQNLDRVELRSYSEEEANEISSWLCTLPLAELNEVHFVEPDMWLDIMSAKACTIAVVCKDKISKLASALLRQHVMSRKACSKLFLST